MFYCPDFNFPYTCHVCQTTFSQQFDLNRHRQIHYRAISASPTLPIHGSMIAQNEVIPDCCAKIAEPNLSDTLVTQIASNDINATATTILTNQKRRADHALHSRQLVTEQLCLHYRRQTSEFDSRLSELFNAPNEVMCDSNIVSTCATQSSQLSQTQLICSANDISSSYDKSVSVPSKTLNSTSIGVGVFDAYRREGVLLQEISSAAYCPYAITVLTPVKRRRIDCCTTPSDAYPASATRGLLMEGSFSYPLLTPMAVPDNVVPVISPIITDLTALG